jgi:transposase-like protein
MSDEEARATFRAIRWAATDGEPVCPRCGCLACYEYESRPIFKCKGCGHQFSATSGTMFSSRKLPVRDYLLAIAIFVNGAKVVSERGSMAPDARQTLGRARCGCYIMARIGPCESCAASCRLRKVRGHRDGFEGPTRAPMLR